MALGHVLRALRSPALDTLGLRCRGMRRRVGAATCKQTAILASTSSELCVTRRRSCKFLYCKR